MKKSDITFGITAFVDILGFSNQVLEAESFQEITIIHDQVKKIQNEFEFKPKDRITKGMQKLYKISVLAFTDCIVINIPFESEITNDSGTLDPILTKLSEFGYAQAACVMNSLFIRGGIDMGWWFQKKETLISKSMVNAYKTENSVIAPVIGISKEFYTELASHPDLDSYIDHNPLDEVLRKGTIKDIEFWFIDYISLNVQLFYSQTAIDSWLIEHAKRIKEAYRKTEIKSVKEKYVWLQNYHNEVAKNYTTNKKCLCS